MIEWMAGIRKEKTMGMARVRQCARCKRIYDRKTEEFKAVHPFVLAYMQTRADDFTLEVCPACKEAQRVCEEQVQQIFSIRQHEVWPELVEN